MILNALEGRPLPVYGNGENVRDWLHVEDHARALRRVLEAGEPGGSYNVGGGAERRNIDVVHAVCGILDELAPRRAGPYRELVRFVADRPGHDERYAVDGTRLREELGWRPRERFEAGLQKTVHWYLEHPEWVKRARTGECRERTRIDLAGREEAR